MTTGFSAAIILLLVTLVIASAGLVLLILGLILKKPGQWVPGIILTAVSLILGIFSMVFFISAADNNSYRHKDYSHYNYNDPYYDNNDEQNLSPEIARPENNSEASSSRISGFIRDADNSLVYIKVFPAPELYDMGIKVIKIDTYNGSGEDKKVIALELNFENKFKGNLQLMLFSKSDEELGSSHIQVNQEGSDAFTVKFVFPKTANFLQTDYARLKTSD